MPVTPAVPPRPKLQPRTPAPSGLQPQGRLQAQVPPPAAAGPEAPARRVLFAAPHRPMFFSGGLMLLVTFGLWAVELAARAGLLPSLGWALPPGWMHAMLVVAGVFPFFIFGFILTTMPRWQGEHEVKAERWLGPWRLLAGGWALALAGLWMPPLLVAGLAAVLAGWIGIVRALRPLVFNGSPDSLQARVVWCALGAGILALAAWIIAVLSREHTWARVAINVGVWWCLVPVFFTVCYRMIPFFSSGAIAGYQVVRTPRLYGFVIGASVLHGALAIAGFGTSTWLIDLPAGAAALSLTVLWRPLAALRVPLLGMLHIGFAWLGIALLLAGVQGVVAVAGGQAWLGLAPLHALGVGFFGSVLLGMVSRVTLGHSGGKLVADRLTWSLFLGLELVVVVRLAAEVVPPAWASMTMLTAAAGWVGVFSLWAIRYLPIYLRPRSDGRPG